MVVTDMKVRPMHKCPEVITRMTLLNDSRVCKVSDLCTSRCNYIGNGAQYDQSYYCSVKYIAFLSLTWCRARHVDVSLYAAV